MKKKSMRLSALLLSLLLLFVNIVVFQDQQVNAETKETETEVAEEEKKEEFKLPEPSLDWEEVLEKAKGSTVTFYGWGGDELRNNWLKGPVAEYIKENYEITLDVVGMDIDDILAKLSGEKSAKTEEGSIDIIWINGENFYSAKENDLLYGPFLQELPNLEKYLNFEDPELHKDFAYPIEGYEAPYGKAQLALFNDSEITPETPSSAEELLEFVKKYPGKVTYPALPDFTGSAFVRNLIYEICGWEQFQDMEPEKEVVKEAIEPALEYLRELNPYLWKEGKTFPESYPALDNMFQDGELVLNMNYNPYHVATGIEQELYSESTRSFVFDKGTIGNTSYIAIAANSANKEAAMVVINAIVSADLQLSQFEELRTLPVIDNEKLSDEEKAAFDAVELGKGVLPQDELLSKRLPEPPAKILTLIEEIWLEEVVGKTNE